MNNAIRLDGTVVIVTGAGRGIGRAHAELLAARGAKVVVNDLPTSNAADDSMPSDATQAILAANGEAMDARVDISDSDGAQRVVDIALERFGRLDAVVNNAGTFSAAHRLEEMTIDDFAQMWTTNFATTYHVTMAAWPHLADSPRGRLINTTSTAGIYGSGTNLDYSAAKGAILSFTAALAATSVGRVQVNAISPGGFTAMIDSRFPRDPERSAIRHALRPELASPLVAFLLHEDCTVHGQVFESMAGRVARIFTGAPDGFWDRDMTPESLAAGWEHVADAAGVRYRSGFNEWLNWQLTHSATIGAGEHDAR